MRRKSMTVGAIDGLFSIVEDPTQFVKWEMITGAKLATVMAVAIWTLPLAAVFSPATLTSEMGTFVENRTCGAVPSLDFTAEMDSNYRLTKLINGGYAISTFYVNTTDIFSCQLYETNYTFQFNFISGQQNVTTKRRDFIKPLLNTTLDPITGDAFPESAWMRPDTNPRQYKKFCTYHATAQLFREWLGGTIDKTPFKGARLATEASTTKLINYTLSYPVVDLQEQVQSMYEDLLLSLLADPQLNIGTNASVPCTRLRRVSKFKYQQTGLWVPYAIVIAISFVCMIIGFQAMVNNGVSSDTVFSRIMTTTRNPTLDRLSVGACLGSDPFPKELERTKLRFGVLDGEHGGEEVWIGGARIEHCGFGTEDEIGPITKGKPYA
ncbi:hypothetical protein EG327_010621 [Venturia inaequalis]|uniref:Uncharacterized protein n=1 Tax=Venturia inaequalis TaxID=5025 RepID=A0A8H3ZD84_VENIN|nr:hypothetical protein EG327_010621 [Venturia inaequalis]